MTNFFKLDLSKLEIPKKVDDYDQFDWEKKSKAVCINNEGTGIVLFYGGPHLEFEIKEVGCQLDFLGLDDCPNGIWVWKGIFESIECSNGDYGYDYSFMPKGEFKQPDINEWQSIQNNINPWNKSDWLKPCIQPMPEPTSIIFLNPSKQIGLSETPQVVHNTKCMCTTFAMCELCKTYSKPTGNDICRYCKIRPLDGNLVTSICLECYDTEAQKIETSYTCKNCKQSNCIDGEICGVSPTGWRRISSTIIPIVKNNGGALKSDDIVCTNQMTKSPEKVKLKCECGTDKSGGGIHSSWCQKS